MYASDLEVGWPRAKWGCTGRVTGRATAQSRGDPTDRSSLLRPACPRAVFVTSDPRPRMHHDPAARPGRSFRDEVEGRTSHHAPALHPSVGSVLARGCLWDL